MEIKQVFIKCHDNDFWDYYKVSLFSLYYWYKLSYSKLCDVSDIENFIQKTLDNLYELSHKNSDEKKFPYKVKVTINDEAVLAYIKESKWGNSECAYMDIETYLITPGATIEDFIYNI